MSISSRVKKDLPKAYNNFFQEGKFGDIKSGMLDDRLIGQRVVSEDHFGTIKYVGGLPNSSGVWLGIDWDDETRGRHDGSHAGVRYFETASSSSGSFMRPNKVNLGLTIEEAIDLRYGSHEGADTFLMEEFFLASSDSDDECGSGGRAISRPSGNHQKVRVHISGPGQGAGAGQQLDKLRSAVLHSLPVSRCLRPGESSEGGFKALGSMCPLLEDLDLAQSLLAAWPEAARACAQLPLLASLNLSDNRLGPLFDGREDAVRATLYEEAFAGLRAIVLVRLRIDWRELLAVLSLCPRLGHVCLAHNQLASTVPPSLHLAAPLLTYLDLACNRLADWQGQIMPLGRLRLLETLLLNDNQLTEVRLPGPAHQDSTFFPRLRLLAISGNLLADWSSVHEMARLSSLDELIFMANPLLDGHPNPETARQDVIANLPRVRVLNRNEVRPEERRGAEIDYLKRHGGEWLAARGDEGALAAFGGCHPRFAVLAAVLGAPEASEVVAAPRRLRDRLLEVRVRSLLAAPGQADLTRGLPASMTVRHLRVLLRRLCRVPPAQEFSLGYESASRPGLVVPLEADTREVAFYGLQAGDLVLLRPL